MTSLMVISKFINPTLISGVFYFPLYLSYMKQIIRRVLKEESLKSTLKLMVKSDGWESTYPLIGNPETLAEIAYDNDPMEFIDSLGLKKQVKVNLGSISFKNNEGTPFFAVYPSLDVVEVNLDLSDFLLNGFKLDKDDAKNVIKDWLFNRHEIDITRVYI